MIDVELLKRLYISYGFEISNEDDLVCVFIYRKSRYFGVDIICYQDVPGVNKSCENIRTKYSQIGYAVNIKQITSNEEAEIELFKSFFSFDATQERLKRKYLEFQRKQTKSLLGYDYEYIDTPVEYQDLELIDGSVFNVIGNKFRSRFAELIIIEAAAGFGKTCTAYEILNHITTAASDQIPVFTELSRNRAAKIFRYILLDEIDLEYPSLNSDLVVKEIKNGRIPLIIDGFDELLSKVDTAATLNNAFDEVESMLDTIGSLLDFKTKIVLTTRRTAIFTGIEFENWVRKWESKFRLTRITLKDPKIEDWIGQEKLELIREKQVPIQYIANPVILTFLKNINLLSFINLIDKPELLVEKYFEKMLEREIERQNLIMTVQNQKEVFKNVARILVELDTTVEDKSFFKEIILDQNRKLLENTRALYSGIDKPSMENLVDTLSTHALLDRKGRDQTQIGFINDFVFGTFIGEIVYETPIEKIQKEFSTYMIELAVTAFRVQNKEKRSKLWEAIQPIIFRFQTDIIFSIDIYLTGRANRNFSEITINDMAFFDVYFTEFDVEASVFLNCNFKYSVFKSQLLTGVTFINCLFDSCVVEDSEFLDNQNEITVINSKQVNCSIFVEERMNYGGDFQIVTDLEYELLRSLWSIANTKGHHVTQLLTSLGREKRRDIEKTLKSLEEKGYITVRGIYVYFETNRIPEIREILQLQ